MENVPEKVLVPLELLIPWELPLDQHLPASERKPISRALRQLLQALETPSPQQSLPTINQALADLGEIETQIADVNNTKTALKTWEVKDYDLYFHIRHVHTEQSALCLVKGLLITCLQFMEICTQTPWLDAKQIQQQKQGFISYSHLLMRVFDVSQTEL